MIPFDPLFRNPHLQTIAGHFWPRPQCESRWPLRARYFPTEPGVQVLVESQYPESGAETPVSGLFLVHGMEGSGQAGYIRSLAAAALTAGFAVHRFHLRPVYHAGLTDDLLSVLRQFRAEGHPPACLAGFSLGGNMVLKLAGELADSAPTLIRAVCGVSTPLDLAASAERIARWDNRLYERRFLRRMRARLCAAGISSRGDFAGLESLVAVDSRITAPTFGFASAGHYYRSQSALHFLPAIRIPTLLIQAKDDTFVPFAAFESAALRSNPFVHLLATPHGGHLGFLARGPHRFWLDHAILDWLQSPAVNVVEQARS